MMIQADGQAGRGKGTHLAGFQFCNRARIQSHNNDAQVDRVFCVNDEWLEQAPQTALSTGYTDDFSSHRVNSIDYADFDSSSSLPWLRSDETSVTSYAVSVAAGRSADTFRCSVESNSADSWDSRQPASEILAAPAVSCRGLRVPRYVGLRGTQQTGEIAADGIVILREGEAPAVARNSENFIDQFLVTQTRGETGVNDDDDRLSVIRLRP